MMSPDTLPQAEARGKEKAPSVTQATTLDVGLLWLSG